MKPKGNDHVDWMSQAYKDSGFEEDFKKNPWFGKPLPETSLSSGNVYDNFLKTAKDAGYLPLWIKMQKEIRAGLQETLKLVGLKAKEAELIHSIESINEKIKRYNDICPPNMQRRKIEADRIREQYKHWQ